jgi:membrane-associated phospholipid phosphatase
MSADDVRAGEEEDRAIRHRTEVLLVISALVVLVISALPAQHGESSRAERTVFRWINDLPGVLYGPVNVVMQLGNIVAVVVVAVIALLFRRYRLALGLALAGIGAYFIATVIKHLVDRGRPTDLIDHVHVRGEQAAGLGYVSGHAAVAFAVVTVATMWFEGKVRALLWGLAVTVALARVYVGAHLPLDVLGGAALGIVCGAIARLVIGARRHGRRRTAGQEGDQPAATSSARPIRSPE